MFASDRMCTVLLRLREFRVAARAMRSGFAAQFVAAVGSAFAGLMCLLLFAHGEHVPPVW